MMRTAELAKLAERFQIKFITIRDRELGVKSLRLLTNNPDKVYQLSEFGLEISERVPIQMTATPYDLFYLKTKQARMGHLLEY